jgi:chromosome segregation ATPase
MQSDLLVALEEANRAVKGLLSKLSVNSEEANHAVVSPGELKALAEKLAQVAKLLALVSPAQPNQEALQAAISGYADNLQMLKSVLGKLQDSLGKQRDRLRKDFERLNSARAWLKTFHTTH